MSVAAKLAEKAALKLLKKTSIFVTDTLKFIDDHGVTEAKKHLGDTRVKKAKKKIDDKKAKEQLKGRAKQQEKKAEEKKTGKKTAKSTSKKPRRVKSKRGKQKRTKEESKELGKLIAQQKKELRDEAFPPSGSTAGGGREQMLIRPGRVAGRKRLPREVVEHPSGRLKSLHEFTEDQLKSFEPGEVVEQRLKPHADPTSMIYQQMRGQELTPSQDAEFQALLEQGWGLDRKRGGQVRQYSIGGQIGSGVGTAMRGWGAVSRKKRST